jgi:hypothetical protein
MMTLGKWWLVMPALLGLLMLSRFIPPISWLSRISFAFILGISSGVAIPRQLSSFILQQVQGTLKPWVVTTNGDAASLTFASLNTLLIIVGVISVLCYFFFSIEHTGAARRVARVGIYFLMISFGQPPAIGQVWRACPC